MGGSWVVLVEMNDLFVCLFGWLVVVSESRRSFPVC